VGNADGEGRPGLTGTSSAAPLLFEIFDQLKHERWFQFPESEIVEIDICAKSGFRPGQYCSYLKKQKVTLAGKTSETCPYCKIIHCDSSLNFRVHSECEKVSKIISKSWFILPPVMEWYYRKKHYEYQPLPPFRDDCLELFYEKASSTMSLIYPRSGAKIYIPVELDGIRGKTIFEAAHRDSKTTLHWHIDNEYTGSTKDLHQISCSPTPGTHILTVVDENGERIERKFEILQGDN
jgi:penicillin-binding protein 1C